MAPTYNPILENLSCRLFTFSCASWYSEIDCAVFEVVPDLNRCIRIRLHSSSVNSSGFVGLFSLEGSLAAGVVSVGAASLGTGLTSSEVVAALVVAFAAGFGAGLAGAFCIDFAATFDAAFGAAFAAGFGSYLSASGGATSGSVCGGGTS